jgi:DNA (cytosine-5)-methyltransferase 1
MVKSKFAAIDVFAGCGGLSLGLKRAGFDIRAAVEIDDIARDTYAANLPGVQLFNDALNVTADELMSACDNKEIALLAGCAPCQGFCSLTAKNKTYGDPRNALVLRMAELVAELKPRAVMMENVPGIVTRGAEIFERFICELEELGYPARRAWRIVQMANYGIGQFRRRFVLLVGHGFEIPFPVATHAKQPKKGSHLKPWLTLKRTIGERPAPILFKNAQAAGGPRAHNWHVVSNLQPQVARRLAAAIPGKTWLSVDEKIRPKCHRGDYQGFTNVYGRMSWKQTSVTMTAGCTTPCKGRFGHPNKRRTTISVREAAVIQGFPENYDFVTDEMEAVCGLIGNAVPPPFAELAGASIRDTLLNQDESMANAHTAGKDNIRNAYEIAIDVSSSKRRKRDNRTETTSATTRT